MIDTLAKGLRLRLLPPVPSPPDRRHRAAWWDLPGRALAALGLVLGLTAFSGALGPHLSGLLAPFPIITSVLAVFSCSRLQLAPATS